MSTKKEDSEKGSDVERKLIGAGEILEMNEEGELVVIDTGTGERISDIGIADKQDAEYDEDTTETVVINNDGNNIEDEETGLTTNQILMGILDALNTRNRLAQEQNKRLRTTNKLLRRMVGLEGPIDKTVQGTPPKEDNKIE